MGMYVSRRKQLIIGVGFLILIAGLFQNCSKIEFGDSGALSSLSQQSAGSAPAVVCNPLDNAASTGASASSQENGLIAKLLYVPLANQVAANLKNYSDLVAQGVTSPASIYLSQVNVPTRQWTQGYSTEGQNALVDDQGNKLLEYFALQMQTNLKLAAGDAPGFYQFAVISDDGGLIASTDANGPQVLAGSVGGWHSTKAECGTVTQYLDQSSSLNLNLLYYQGPRNAIGMVTMWRKLPSGAIPDQVGCGANNSNFFVEPAAGQPSDYEKMLAAGWNAIPSQNFFLPKAAGVNPCASGT